MSVPAPKLDSSLDKPALFGAIINCTMTGMLLVQVTTYFTRYKRDSTWLKCLVAFSSAISCSGAILAVVNLYLLVIPEPHVQRPHSTIWTPGFRAYLVMPSVQSATVQLYFSWRASRFIGSRAFFIATIVSALLQIASALATNLLGVYHPGWNRGRTLDPTCILPNAIASVTDLSISTILTYHLIKRRTGFADTDYLLFKLARLTLQAGIITAGWAMSTLFLYIILHNNVHLILLMSQTPLYANVLLAALNCRLRSETENGPEKTGAFIANSPIDPDKSRVPVSEVTFMSIGVKSELSCAESGMTMSSEQSFGI